MQEARWARVKKVLELADQRVKVEDQLYKLHQIRGYDLVAKQAGVTDKIQVARCFEVTFRQKGNLDAIVLTARDQDGEVGRLNQLLVDTAIKYLEDQLSYTDMMLTEADDALCKAGIQAPQAKKIRDTSTVSRTVAESSDPEDKA